MGATLLHLPSAGLYPMAGLAWRLRLRAVSEVPPAMLDYIRYPWVADGSKVTRLTGFQYRYDGQATFEDFLRGRIGQASQEQDRAAGPITDQKEDRVIG